MQIEGEAEIDYWIWFGDTYDAIIQQVKKKGYEKRQKK